MDKYLDEKIKKLEILLDRDALSTYGGGMLDAYKDVKRQLALCNVVGQSEQLNCEHPIEQRKINHFTGLEYCGVCDENT